MSFLFFFLLNILTETRAAPLLLVENTALIGITTPMEDTCDYSQMMEMKHDNGEPMFNAISVSLMCEACRKAGLMECPHMAHEARTHIPPRSC